VTDLLLPWLNGYQAIQCLAACPALPAPVFIIGSALTRRELTANRSYLQDNAVLYIDKPFEGEHLLALVEQALAR
jgi:CheY-like chemotaxis protein